jgi:hypothetical protein
MPVLVLLLFLRVSSEGVEKRDLRPSAALPAASLGEEVGAAAPGDFAPPFPPIHNLYLSSGLLGGLDGRAGGAACIELETDAAGDAGVMANVAASNRIGELGRGEGVAEKLNAFEAFEGVTGWDMEP